MIDENGDYWSPARRLNALRIDDAFFERNTFDKDKALDVLESVLVTCELTDEQMEGIVALSRGLRGTHPKMAINVSFVQDGVTPRPLMEIRKGSLSMAVADKVDVMVADGSKQESAIAECEEAFGISRREIFRMLKTGRERRIWMREQEGEGEFADWDCWYDNYEITPDGRLVPRNSGD